MIKKVRTKIEISQEQKKLSRWNKKHFSLSLKAYQSPEKVLDLRVDLYVVRCVVYSVFGDNVVPFHLW